MSSLNPPRPLDIQNSLNPLNPLKNSNFLNAGVDEMIPGQVLTEEEEIYKENIIDHYRHPRNSGVLDQYAFTHQELNPLCGDKLQVFVVLDQDKINNISFVGTGCAISQAAMSLLTEQLQGKLISEIKRMGPWDIFNLLGIRISHTRSKCALLSLKTIQQGLREHLEKSKGEESRGEELGEKELVDEKKMKAEPRVGESMMREQRKNGAEYHAEEQSWL